MKFFKEKRYFACGSCKMILLPCPCTLTIAVIGFYKPELYDLLERTLGKIIDEALIRKVTIISDLSKSGDPLGVVYAKEEHFKYVIDPTDWRDLKSNGPTSWRCDVPYKPAFSWKPKTFADADCVVAFSDDSPDTVNSLRNALIAGKTVNTFKY